MRVILEGIVGSTAYGLARAGSDIDILGVYLAPAEDFLGLYPPNDKNSTVRTRWPSERGLLADFAGSPSPASDAAGRELRLDSSEGSAA